MPQVEVKIQAEKLSSIASHLRHILLSQKQSLPSGPWAVVARNGETDDICIIKGQGPSPALLEVFFRPDFPREKQRTIKFLAAMGTNNEKQFYTLSPEAFISWPQGQVESLWRVSSQDFPLPGIHLTVSYIGLSEDVTVKPGESMNQTQILDFASYLEKARNLLLSENPPIVYNLSLATRG